MKNQTIKKSGRKNQHRTRRMNGGAISITEVLKKIQENPQNSNSFTTEATNTLKQKRYNYYKTTVDSVAKLVDVLDKHIDLVKNFKKEYQTFVTDYEKESNIYTKAREILRDPGQILNNNLKTLKHSESASNALEKILTNLKKLDKYGRLKDMIKSLYNSTIFNIFEIKDSKVVVNFIEYQYDKLEQRITELMSSPKVHLDNNNRQREAIAGGGPFDKITQAFTEFGDRRKISQAEKMQAEIEQREDAIKDKMAKITGRSKEYTEKFATFNKKIITNKGEIIKYIDILSMHLFYILHIIKYIDSLSKKLISLTNEIDIVAAMSIIDRLNNMYIFYINNKVFKDHEEIFKYVIQKIGDKRGELGYESTQTRPPTVTRARNHPYPDVAILSPTSSNNQDVLGEEREPQFKPAPITSNDFDPHTAPQAPSSPSPNKQ